MHVFYTPEIEQPSFSMNEMESNHAIRVLRLNQGDEIRLMDGKGGIYAARILHPSKKSCEVEVTSIIVQDDAPTNKLHLAVAPTKNMDRYLFFVEKSVEIGVGEITPIYCDHSERKVIKTDKIINIVISAAKQSVSTHIPVVNEPIHLNEMLLHPFEGSKYIAHCMESEKKRPLKELYSAQGDCLILIGPEGDFSEREIKEALSKNYIPVSLSNKRLRTETAAIVACHTINLLNA